MISLIAAIGKNNELGKGNTLLWHMPADMKFFRETTRGHTVIMGRKTFESLKGPLPNRKNIVITRDENYKKEGIEVIHSLDKALGQAQDEHEVFIIGGAEIYKQCMNIADKLYITHIDAEDKDADSFFPEIIPIAWNETSHIEHKKDSENPFNYTFSVYDKFM
ncbi:MAG TPA: dihydrofolate reductase [Candidatus Paceibacterota bacterium]|jgi:dihydrofolate reductase|nr:dihydrofolate reductase [Candidatus Paceibacterota bacterium]